MGILEIALLLYLGTNLSIVYLFTIFIFTNKKYLSTSKYEVLKCYFALLTIGMPYAIYNLFIRRV